MKKFPDSALYFLIFLLSVSLFYHFTVSIPKLPIAGTDFTAFLTGAQMIKEGKGKLLYDLKSQRATQQEIIKPIWPYEKRLLPFRSLPFVGFFFLSFSYFNLILSYKLFVVFNLVLLFLFILLSTRLFEAINKSKAWLLIPLVYIPVLHTLVQGQISLILTLNLLFIYQFIKLKKSFIAGILYSLLLLKPQYLIIFPFLFILTKNKHRFISGALLSFSILLLISGWVSGPAALLNYPAFILSTENPHHRTYANHMGSLNSLLSLPFLSLSPFSILIFNGLLYLFFLVLFIQRYRLIGFEQSFAAAVLLSMLFAIHVLSPDWALLLIPTYLMTNQSLTKNDHKAIPILVFSVIFISTSALFSNRMVAVIFLVFLAIILLFYQPIKNIESVTKKNQWRIS